MTDGASLYLRRKHADPRRQPSHAALFDQLDHALSTLAPPRDNPYGLARKEYSTVGSCGAYTSVNRGLRASITVEYCYRLTTWPRLVRDLANIPDGYLWTLPLDADESEAFKHIDGKQSGNTWLALSALLRGTLRGRRGFTWWTSATLPSPKLMCSAHYMGLLNTEVGGEVLILRCKTSGIRLGKPTVPSIVDGFFSHIFCSMRDSDNPRCGRAISLEDPGALSLGAEEFIVGDLDIALSEIEVRAVNLNATPVHQVHVEDVYDSLSLYYEALAC